MNLGAAAATNVVYFVQPGDTPNSVAAAILIPAAGGGAAVVNYNALTDDSGNPLDPNASLSSYSEIDIPAGWLTAAAAASYGVSGPGIQGTAGTPLLPGATAGSSSTNPLLLIGVAIVLFMVLNERKGR